MVHVEIHHSTGFTPNATKGNALLDPRCVVPSTEIITGALLTPE